MTRGRSDGPMALMGLVLASLMLVLLSFAPVTFAQEPALVIEPNKGTYGLQIFLKGTGFAPNTQVQIEAFGQTIAPQSNSAGEFLVIAYAPTDQAKFKPGGFNIVARDSASHSAQGAFQLEELIATVRPGGPAAAGESAPISTAVPGRQPSLIDSLGNLGWLVVVVAGVAVLALLVFAVFALNRRKAATALPSSAGTRPSQVRGGTSRPAAPAHPRSAESVPSAADSAATSETTLVMPAVPKLSSRPTLQVVSGDGAGSVYPLEQKTTVIGRGEDCDIVVNHPMVSRHHAKIVRVGPSYYIHDLQSTNSTQVNGERIDQHVLQTDDEIQIGVTLFLFQQPNPEQPA